MINSTRQKVGSYDFKSFNQTLKKDFNLSRKTHLSQKVFYDGTQSNLKDEQKRNGKIVTK